VWGGGVLEYDVQDRSLEGLQRSRWRDRNGAADKDQGLIHEVTTSVSYAEKDHVLWVATYFGASRYDGRYWKNFLEKDSGLAQQFSEPGESSVDGQSGVVLNGQGTGLRTMARTGRSTGPRSIQAAPEMLIARCLAGKGHAIAPVHHGARAQLHPRLWIFRATISG
jgi:hypothetical protein